MIQLEGIILWPLFLVENRSNTIWCYAKESCLYPTILIYSKIFSHVSSVEYVIYTKLHYGLTPLQVVHWKSHLCILLLGWIHNCSGSYKLSPYDIHWDFQTVLSPNCWSRNWMVRNTACTNLPNRVHNFLPSAELRLLDLCPFQFCILKPRRLLSRLLWYFCWKQKDVFTKSR